MTDKFGFRRENYAACVPDYASNSLDYSKSSTGASSQNPQIKRLLRNYQVSAERSLDGPPSRAFQPDVEGPVSPVQSRMASEPSRPMRMPPFLMPMDRSAAEFCQRTETGLEGKMISCFVVGGERRLCLPQILNTCLGRFTLAQIYGACDTLQINCAPCNVAQLGTLKRDGILPASASCCGLITLSDAQRLCNALLRGAGTASSLPPPPRELFERYTGIPVMHRCFGRCTGTMFPGVTIVRSSVAAVVICDDCRQSFSVEDFVCHSHGHQESRTCHWGFDVANWRFYLQLAPGVPDEERLQDQLDAVKAGRCGRVSPPPRKRLEASCSSIPASLQSGGVDRDAGQPPATKRPRCVSERQSCPGGRRSPSPLVDVTATSPDPSPLTRHHSVVCPSTTNPAREQPQIRRADAPDVKGSRSCADRNHSTSTNSLDRFDGQFVPNVSLVASRSPPPDDRAAEEEQRRDGPAPPQDQRHWTAADDGVRDRRHRPSSRRPAAAAAASVPGRRDTPWRPAPIASDAAAASAVNDGMAPNPATFNPPAAASKSSMVVSVIADLLDAELNLFKAALFGGAAGPRAPEHCDQFLGEFTTLQRRHVDVIRGVLQSHKDIQQELSAQRRELAVRVESAAAEAESRRRQIEAVQREDDAKLREARRENDQLRAELDALVSGAKRSDIGLVKAKYKARAKHFQRKLEQMEQANAHLVREISGLHEVLQRQQQQMAAAASTSLRGTAGQPPQLPLSPTSVGEASPTETASCVA